MENEKAVPWAKDSELLTQSQKHKTSLVLPLSETVRGLNIMVTLGVTMKIVEDYEPLH
jgi:hypothetical protein